VAEVSADKIRRAKVGSVTQWTIGKGLYLKANWNPGAFHAWRFDFKNPTTGRRDTMTFGNFPAISIGDAKAAAAEARSIIAMNKCPKAHREAVRKARAEGIAAAELAARLIAEGKAAPGTVRAVADEFLTGRWVAGCKKNQWSDSYAGRWMQLLNKHVHPFIGDMQCCDVTPADIFAVIARMDASGYHTASSVVRIHLKQTFSLAQVLGLCKADPVAPVAVVVRRARSVESHKAVTTPGALVELFKAINTAPNLTKRAALLVSLYTAQRPGNVQAMEWEHIDFDAAQWTIPAASMKRTKAMKARGDAHIVPLSRQAVAVLREVFDAVEKDAAGVPVSPYVFANQEWASGYGKPLSADRVRDELNRLGFKGRHTLHGFRATFRTMGREVLGVPREVLEAQLAHGNGEALGTAYARESWLAERAEAVQGWADYIGRLSASGTVVELAKRAA
jgi:integrase